MLNGCQIFHVTEFVCTSSKHCNFESSYGTAFVQLELSILYDTLQLLWFQTSSGKTSCFKLSLKVYDYSRLRMVLTMLSSVSNKYQETLAVLQFSQYLSPKIDQKVSWSSVVWFVYESRVPQRSILYTLSVFSFEFIVEQCRYLVKIANKGMLRWFVPLAAVLLGCCRCESQEEHKTPGLICYGMQYCLWWINK